MAQLSYKITFCLQVEGRKLHEKQYLKKMVQGRK